MGCRNYTIDLHDVPVQRYVVWASPDVTRGEEGVLVHRSIVNSFDTWSVLIYRREVIPTPTALRGFNSEQRLLENLRARIPDGVWWNPRQNWRDAVSSVMEGRDADRSGDSPPEGG